MGKWLAVMAIGVCVAAVLVGGCKRSPPAAAPGPSYFIVDLRASQEWLAAHSITATLDAQPVTLPLVLQASPDQAYRGEYMHTGPKGEGVVSGEINGRPFKVVVEVTPYARLPLVGGHFFMRGIDVPREFGSALCFIWTPEGEKIPDSSVDPVKLVEQARANGSLIVR